MEQKLRKRKLRTILVQESARSVDRHTLGVDRHQFRPGKNPRCFQVYKRSNLPEKTFLFALLVPGRFRVYIYIVFRPKFLLSSLLSSSLQKPIVRDISYSSLVLQSFHSDLYTVKSSFLFPSLFTVFMLFNSTMFFASSNMPE